MDSFGKWCRRQHPKKVCKWIRAKYFTASDELCCFASVTHSKINDNIVRINKIFRAAIDTILEHNNITTSKNPYLKQDEEYFKDRRRILQANSWKTKQNCVILKKISEIDKKLLNLWKVVPVKSKKKHLEMPKPYDGKLSCTVLKGGTLTDIPNPENKSANFDLN